MGIIEGGSATGVLPDDRLFAVNFPGYPNSLARATQALSGEDRIAETRSALTNYLELKFRPEDPCAHAAFGELSQTSDLLLRIRRKRRKRSDGDAVDTSLDCVAAVEEDSNDAEDFETCADIVGRVEHTYNFDGMADYQYVLAKHADVARRQQKRQREKEGLGNLMDVEQDELMMLVPPLFSIKDMPEDTVLRPSDFVTKKSKKKLTPVQMEANVLPCFAVDFKIAEVPAPLKWEDQLIKQSMEYNLTVATVGLFEERPIWAKATLLERLGDLGVVISDAHVKRLLFRTGYYFGYGPFRTLWIKNGYDPRRDPESRMYQMMDFRLPRTLRDGNSGPERPNAKESGPAWRDICALKAAPIKKFSFLQLFDLQDDYIQDQIRRPAERPSCSEYTGWFRRTTLDRLREHIRARFMGLMPDELARELQGLPRYTPSKTVTWKEDEPSDNIFATPRVMEDPVPQPSVVETDYAGIGIRTPSELTFTPLPDHLSQEEPELEVPEIESEVELPAVEAEEDLEADAGQIQGEEEEEEESDDEEDEEEEEEEDEEEEDDNELPSQYQDGAPEADEMPDGFLKDLLKQFPFGQGYSEAQALGGADEDDAEYAIYEQADEEEED